MKNKKIELLFVINVDWNWIKQRPHFLAEGIGNYIPEIVAYKYKYNRKGLQNRKKNTVNLFPVYTIPRIDRYDSLKWTNSLICRCVIAILLNKHCNADVILTYPNQIKYIPQWFKKNIIYDCMDAHALFTADTKKVEEIRTNERVLCERAAKISCSSAFLKKYLIENYGIKEEKLEIIRNAFDGNIISSTTKPSKNNVFCYFGTIADWFDFDILIESLEDFPTIEYWLCGPIAQGIEIPNNPRIKYLGTIEHAVLYEKVKASLAFIMPFRVDQKIEAVDPVKVYEFINFNRNFIIPQYDEVDRYAQFGYLYTDYNSYVQAVNDVIQRRVTKYTEESRAAFLKQNSWDQRVNTFLRILQK